MGEEPELDEGGRVGVTEVLLGDGDKGAGHRGAVAGDFEAVGICLMLHFAGDAVGDGGEQEGEQRNGQEQGGRRGIVGEAVNVPAEAEAAQQPFGELLGQRQGDKKAGYGQQETPEEML